MNMILILPVYGFNPLPFTSYDENIEYDDRDVFYVNDSKKNLL